jgi:mono/diheme cytochrome c family protein
VAALAAGCDHPQKKKAVTTIGPDRTVARWAREERFADDPHAVAGARIFAASGCLACHTYLRVGSANLSSGDLSSIGRAGQGVRFFERYVADPTRFGNHVMPKYGDLGDPRRLHDLALFLAASKGRR